MIVVKKNISYILFYFLISFFLLPVVFAMDAQQVYSNDRPGFVGTASGFSSTGGGGKCGQQSDCTTGWGIKVSLYDYDYTTKSTGVKGTPYVVWNNQLLKGEIIRGTYTEECNTYTYNGVTKPWACYDWVTYKDTRGWINTTNIAGMSTTKDEDLPSPTSDTDSYLYYIQGNTEQGNSGAKILSGGGVGIGSTLSAVSSKFSTKLYSNEASRYYVAVEPLYRTIPYLSSYIPLASMSGTAAGSYKYIVNTRKSYIYFKSCSQYNSGDIVYKTVQRGIWDDDYCEAYLKSEYSCCERGRYDKEGNLIKCYEWDKCTREIRYAAEDKPNTDFFVWTIREIDAGSKVFSARDRTNKAYCNSTFNSEKGNYHEVDNETYIGPSEQRAMVGGTGSPFGLLSGSVTPSSITSYSCKNRSSDPYGIAFYWLNNYIGCKSYCTGKTGDKLLECAEQYCDEAVREVDTLRSSAKKACIVTQCGYDVSSVSCDTKDSNGNYYDPYHNTTVNSVDNSTICGFSSDDLPDDDDEVADPIEGSTKYCDSSTPENAIEEERKYFNISCLEKTSVAFRDTSRDFLVAGTGLYYYTKIVGQKECQLFFDWNSWKLDYAAIHSEDCDVDLKRDLLIDQATWFNMLVDGTGDQITDSTFKAYGKLRKLSVVNSIGKCQYGAAELIPYPSFVTDYMDNGIIEETIYSSSSEFYTKYTEMLSETVSEESDTYQLIDDSKTERSTPLSSQSTYVLELFDHVYRHEVSKNNTNKTMSINSKYYVKSTMNTTYVMPYQCVSSDGKGTVTGSNSKVCPDGTVARNVFYTSLKAVATELLPDDKDHTVKTDVEVSDYLRIGESCPYNIIEDNADKGYCEIVVSDGTRIGTSDKYLVNRGNTGVELLLTISDGIGISDINYLNISDQLKYPHQDTNGNTITYIGIPTGNVSAEIKENYYYTVVPVLCEDNRTTVTAIVTLKDGSKLECSKELEPILSENYEDDVNSGNGICSTGVECKVEARGSHVYNIEATTGWANVNNKTGYLGWVNAEVNAMLVGPSPYKRSDGRYDHKFRVTDAEELGSYVAFGRVTDKYGNTDVCWLQYSDPDLNCEDGNCKCTNACKPDETSKIQSWCSMYWEEDEEGYSSEEECVTMCGINNCAVTYKQDDVAGIRKYCEKNWDNDVAGYTSYESCLNGCSGGRIRTNCSTIVGLRGYSQSAIVTTCNERWDEFGFSSAENCATLCCTTLGTCSGSGDYIYRPININNPFPNSYLTGQLQDIRPVGGNWIGKEDYILRQTDLDKDDDTNLNTQVAEYIIDLNPAQINAIKKDNETYNETHEGNVYSDYVYINDEHLSSAVPYVSEFIHNSEFTSYFKCTYNPKTKQLEGDCSY